MVRSVCDICIYYHGNGVEVTVVIVQMVVAGDSGCIGNGRNVDGACRCVDCDSGGVYR